MQRDVQVRGWWRRSVAVAGLAGLAVAALAGCTSSGKPEAIDDPRASTTTSTTAPAADTDDVVWQQFTSGGFVPQEYAAGAVPEVTIYRDGRVFTLAEGQDEPPAALQVSQASPDDLEAFLAEAEASGLFEPGTDFGSPGVTDQPSTTVLLKTGDRPQQIDVYALDFAYDSPVGDVTAEQTARRDELKALAARAAALGDDAQPYVPDRVRAVRFDPEIVTGAPTTGAAWPGPPASAFPPFDERTRQSCLVIEGEDATAVSRADQENPERTWDLDGTVQTIVVVPLLPGQEGCPPT